MSIVVTVLLSLSMVTLFSTTSVTSGCGVSMTSLVVASAAAAAAAAFLEAVRLEGMSLGRQLQRDAVMLDVLWL